MKWKMKLIPISALMKTMNPYLIMKKKDQREVEVPSTLKLTKYLNYKDWN